MQIGSKFDSYHCFLFLSWVRPHPHGPMWLRPWPGCVARGGGGHLPRQAAPAYSHPPARTRPRSMRVFLSPRALVPFPRGGSGSLRACRSVTPPHLHARIHRGGYAACAPWAVARLSGAADSASARTGTAGGCAVVCLPRHKSQRPCSASPVLSVRVAASAR